MNMEYISIPRAKFEQMENQVKQIDDIVQSRFIIHRYTDSDFFGDYMRIECVSADEFESEIINSLSNRITLLQDKIKEKNKVIRRYYDMGLMDRIFDHNNGVDYIFNSEIE